MKIKLKIRVIVTCLAIAPGAFTLLGSHSGSAREARSGKTSDSKQSQDSAMKTPEHGWDLNCVFEHLQNPPESFHYSYRHNDVSWEADVSPSSIDGTRTGRDGSRAIHATRSDAESWQ